MANSQQSLPSQTTLSQISIQIEDDSSPIVIYSDHLESEEFDGTPRKRKHPLEPIDTLSPSNSVVKRKSDSYSDQESQSCSICYEPWTTTGLHRIVSLKCGHLFGQSCIDKWLRQASTSSDRRCPQCKMIAVFKDIRPIFASKLTAVDNSELERAVRQLEDERAKAIQAKKCEANMALKYQLSKAECERLKARVLELEMKLQTDREDATDCDNAVCMEDELRVDLTAHKVRELLLTSAGGCRILEINASLGMILVSRPSTVTLYRGFGVVKISTRDLKEYQFVPVHNSVIRDLKFCPNKEDLLLSVSTDKTAKLTSIASNSNVANFVLPAQSWACSWDHDDPNYFYTALNNGSIELFDIRQTGNCLDRLSIGVPKPITAINYVPAFSTAKTSGIAGILVATVSGCYFMEKNNIHNFTSIPLPDLTGNCTSVTYDVDNAKFLASFRPTLTMPMTRHAVCDISRCIPSSQGEGSPIQTTQLYQFTGGPSQSTLSRTHIFTPQKREHLCIAFGDESTRSLELCDTSNCKKVSYHTTKSVVDIKSYNNFIAALTDEKLFIYEMK